MIRLEESSFEEMMQHGVSVQDINQALARDDAAQDTQRKEEDG